MWLCSGNGQVHTWIRLAQLADAPGMLASVGQWPIRGVSTLGNPKRASECVCARIKACHADGLPFRFGLLPKTVVHGLCHRLAV